MKQPNIVDETAAAIRESLVDTEIVTEAAERVWRNLGQASSVGDDPGDHPLRLETCGDFQRLMPAYLQDRLSRGRCLLFEDHTRSCIPCRRALQQAREGRPSTSRVTLDRSPAVHRGRWLAAAAAVAVLSLAGWAWRSGLLAPPEIELVQVRAIDGALLRVQGERFSPLRPGDWIAERESVRTTAGSRAVLRLEDGSLIELGERSQLSFGERRRHTTIRVHRGSILVEAADQRDRELSVATEELLVSVRGTIFAVNHGAKGSRVAVVEGEVRVAAGRRERLLYPGDQFVSNLRLGQLPFASAISWSQDSDRYFDLLREIRDLRRDLSAVSLAQDLRFSTRLLDLAPASTVAYVSFPNIGSSVEEVRSIVDQRLQDSPALEEWWAANVESTGLSGGTGRVLDLLQTVGTELGDEIVVAIGGDPEALGLVVAMTELNDPGGFEEVLMSALGALSDDAPASNFSLRFIVDPFVYTDDEDAMLLWIHDDLLVLSPEIAGLREVAEAVEGGGSFVGSGLHQRIRSLYADGVEVLAGIDLSALVGESLAATAEGEGAALLAWTGIEDAEYLLIDSKQVDDIAQISASLYFSDPRTGAVAWLSEPAPMGSLDFISADATVASAFLFKDPLDIVDELFELLETVGPEALQGLAEVERILGINLRGDLAAPLGGEIAVAMDGPVLPTPSWKIVVEVYDPGLLQRTIETLVDRLNENLIAESQAGPVSLELTSEEIGGRVYHRLAGTREGGTTEIAYVFDAGYLVAAPSIALLDRAIETRQSRYSLLDAPRVQSLMPVDPFLNFSGFVYQDVGSLLAPLADLASGLSANLTEEQQKMVAEFSAESASPSLLGIYGKDEAIRLVATTEGGVLGSAIERLLGAGQLLSLGGLFGVDGIGAPQ